jgi:hypothetical protein
MIVCECAVWENKKKMDGVVVRWRKGAEERSFYARGGMGRRVGGVDAKELPMQAKLTRRPISSREALLKVGLRRRRSGLLRIASSFPQLIHGSDVEFTQ